MHAKRSDSARSGLLVRNRTPMRAPSRALWPLAARLRSRSVPGPGSVLASIGLLAFGISAGLALDTSTPAAHAAPAAQEAPAGALDARQTHAPLLGRAGAGYACVGDVEIHNRGDRPTVVAFIGWGADEMCAHSAEGFGPDHFGCSGLIAPGARWTIAAREIPAAVRSGAFFSLSSEPIAASPGDAPRPVSSIVCAALKTSLFDDAERYRAFKEVFDQGERAAGEFAGVPVASLYGAPIEVVVRRDCDLGAGERSRSDYRAVAGDELTVIELPNAARSATTGLLPLLVADAPNLGTSFIHVQNAGAECGSVELWFKAFDECLRANICEIISIAPGSTRTMDMRDCVAAGAEGVGWIRATQGMSILVDTDSGRTVPAFTHEAGGHRGLLAGGIAREAAQHTTLLHLSSHFTADAVEVEITFRRGDAIDAVWHDWICPKGATTVDPRQVPGLPKGWRGEVQIISLPRPSDHPRPGWTPISGIVSVIEHADPDPPVPVGFARLRAFEPPRFDPISPERALFLPWAGRR